MKKLLLLSACALCLLNSSNLQAAEDETNPLLEEETKHSTPVPPKDKDKFRPRGSGKSPIRSPKGPKGLEGLSALDALKELDALDG